MAKKIKKFDSLGKSIHIYKSAKVMKNPEGFKQEWSVETISIIIGIGKDHTAELIMDLEDWAALKEGQPIYIESI